MNTEVKEDSWWVDFLENEMDPGLERDLQTLLAHSQEDRDAFEGYRILREWLTCSDPVGGWPIEERLGKIRSGVMSAIEKMDVPFQLPLPSEDAYLAPVEEALKSLRA